MGKYGILILIFISVATQAFDEAIVPIGPKLPGTPQISLPNIGTKQCLSEVKQWIEDDKSDRLLGLMKSRASSCVIYTSNLNTAKSATDLNNIFEKKFAAVIGPAFMQKVKSCIKDEDPRSKEVVAKFYYSLNRMRDGVNQTIEQVSAIDSLLPETGLPAMDCAKDFNYFDNKKFCEQYKSCKPASKDDFKAFSAEVAEAAADYQALNKITDECKRLGLNTGIGNLDYSNQFQYKNLNYILNTAHFTRLFPELANQFAQFNEQMPAKNVRILKDNINKVCSPIEQAKLRSLLVEQYPFIEGQIFQSKNAGAGTTHVDQTGEAMKAQLLENRKTLLASQKEMLSATKCIFGRSSFPSENLDCSAAKLSEVLAKAPLTPEIITEEFDKVLKAQQCSSVQAAQLDKERDKAVAIATDVGLTVGTAAITGGASLAGRALLSLRTAYNIERVTAGIGLTSSSIWVGKSVYEVSKSCGPEQAQVRKLANTGEVCASIKNQTSQASRFLDKCIKENLIRLADLLPLASNMTLAKRIIKSESKIGSVASKVDDVISETGGLRNISQADKLDLLNRTRNLSPTESVIAAKRLSPPVGKKLEEGILKAHKYGTPDPVTGLYSKADLRAKAKILKEHGATDEQIDVFMRSGICGEFDDYIRAADQALAEEIAVYKQMTKVERQITELSAANKNPKLSDSKKLEVERQLSAKEKELNDIRLQLYESFESAGTGSADLRRIERYVGHTTRQIEIAEATGSKRLGDLYVRRSRTLREEAEFQAAGEIYSEAKKAYDLASQDIIAAYKKGGLKTYDEKMSAIRSLSNSSMDGAAKDVYDELIQQIARTSNGRSVASQELPMSAFSVNPAIAKNQQGSVWELVREYRDNRIRMDVLERNALESAGANWEKTKFGQTYDNFGERGTRILTAIKDRLLKRYPKSQDRNRILEQLGIDL